MARKWWTLIAVSVATFVLLLDITVVNVALPSIREDLDAGFTDLRWAEAPWPRSRCRRRLPHRGPRTRQLFQEPLGDVPLLSASTVSRGVGTG